MYSIIYITGRGIQKGEKTMTLKEKMMEVGKRWQKNGMDRYYVNYSDIELIEVDDMMVCKHFNRYQRQNVKIYWDAVKDEFVVTQGNDEAKNAVEMAIMAM